MRVQLERWLYRYVSDKPKFVTFEPVRQLSDEEWGNATRALQTLESLVQGTNTNVEITRGDLLRICAQLTDGFRAEKDVRKVEQWIPQLEYRFTAVSLAVRMHEETVLSQANRGKHERGTNLEAVKAVFHQTYDRSFDYRVIYNLRNALAHGSQNLLTFEASQRILPDESRRAHVRVLLDRARFSDSSVKKAVRDEVSELPKNPDLREMAEAASDEVAHMSVALGRLLYPDFDLAVDLIADYIEECHQAGGGGAHFHEHEADDAFAQLSILPMTETIFRYIVSEIQRRRASALGEQ